MPKIHRTTHRELKKLRELVAHFMEGVPCHFCHKPLWLFYRGTTFGNSIGPKLNPKITIHHINENHFDNAKENRAVAHANCHKAYHNQHRKKKELITPGIDCIVEDRGNNTGIIGEQSLERNNPSIMSKSIAENITEKQSELETLMNEWNIAPADQKQGLQEQMNEIERKVRWYQARINTVRKPKEAVVSPETKEAPVEDPRQ